MISLASYFNLTLDTLAPTNVSVGEKKANIECRIFKNGKVYEVIRFKVNVIPAKKPDLVPVDM